MVAALPDTGHAACRRIGPDLAGGFFVEPVLAVLYALSIVAWSRAALVFGRRVALVTAVALLLYHGYALMFHELSSEAMLAAAFAGFALALARAASGRPPVASCWSDWPRP